MALAIGTRLGPYEVVALLGAGGMGEVYRARDTRLDRDVAIKILPETVGSDPDRLARFEREARAVAALSHPGILAIHVRVFVSPCHIIRSVPRQGVHAQVASVRCAIASAR
jgi:serine/threonine protein kinase